MAQNKEQTQLVKDLIRAIEMSHTNRKQLIWVNFFAGIMRGIGTTIGAGLVLAGASVLLHQLGVFNTVSDWFSAIL